MIRRHVAWVVVALAGCGVPAAGEKPWDQNGDGLVGTCEGLSKPSCSTTPGCRAEELACDLACRDDGKGGCLPCDAYACVPTTPADACKNLNPAQCAANPACELEQAACLAICEDDGKGGCKPCPAVTICRPKQPAPPFSCGQIPTGACKIFPQCELKSVTVCSGSAGPSSGSGGAPAPEADFAPPEKKPAPPVQPDAGCGQTCHVVLTCVDRQGPTCENRSPNTCEADGKCRLESWACPAICIDDGKGGCQPCTAPPPRCVPNIPLPPPPPPSRCLNQPTRAACSAAGCQVVESVCQAICAPAKDGGGCDVPCTPRWSCQEPTTAVDAGTPPTNP